MYSIKAQLNSDHLPSSRATCKPLFIKYELWWNTASSLPPRMQNPWILRGNCNRLELDLGIRGRSRDESQRLPRDACIRVHVYMLSHFSLCNSMDCSLPVSSVHGIFFLGKNTAIGCHSLLQGIFPTQGLNPSLLCLLHRQVDFFFFLPLSHLGSPLY